MRQSCTSSVVPIAQIGSTPDIRAKNPSMISFKLLQTNKKKIEPDKPDSVSNKETGFISRFQTGNSNKPAALQG